MELDPHFMQRYADECEKAGIEPLPLSEAVALALAIGIALAADEWHAAGDHTLH